MRYNKLQAIFYHILQSIKQKRDRISGGIYYLFIFYHFYMGYKYPMNHKIIIFFINFYYLFVIYLFKIFLLLVKFMIKKTKNKFIH